MSDDLYPTDLRYHPEHDWARLDEGVAIIGITWFAQDALGEVVFADLPEPGTRTTKDESYAEVESVKSVSDVIAPVTGVILEVNEALAEAPTLLNEDPYGRGWIARVRLDDADEVATLLDRDAYLALIR